MRKFKNKNKGLILLGKIAAIWYLILITGSYLTSNTSAYFNDSAQVSGVIKAGIWEEEDDSGPWDKSSLKFIGSNGSIEACTTTTISSQIKNNGKDMKGTSKFEVYYAETGNPKKGTKIGDGTIPKIASDQTVTVTFEVDKPGNYMFRALQRPGHPGQGDLWSDQMTISCKDSKSETQQKSDEQKEDQTESTNPETSKGQTEPVDSNPQNDQAESNNENQTESNDANKEEKAKEETPSNDTATETKQQDQKTQDDGKTTADPNKKSDGDN